MSCTVKNLTLAEKYKIVLDFLVSLRRTLMGLSLHKYVQELDDVLDYIDESQRRSGHHPKCNC